MLNITPIEKYDNIFVKRDDLYKIAGVSGGKARSCWHLCTQPTTASGLVTASSKHSPQLLIVASIANHLHIPAHLHVPSGEWTNEMYKAKSLGAEIIQHKAGYNNVIIARAKEDATSRNIRYIPFGMECLDAITETSKQVQDIPPEVERIVIPVGSGMSLGGLLTGLQENQISLPVLGIQVGADPYKRLSRYAPLFWQQMVTIVKSEYKYETRLEETYVGKVLLDPVYEAKCKSYLKNNDLLWVVGRRQE